MIATTRRSVLPCRCVVSRRRRLLVRGATGAGRAETTVRRMYEYINAGDAVSAVGEVAEKCIYEDMNFNERFKGKNEVAKLFAESVSSCPEGLTFVIDEAAGDETGVGVTWHCEIEGGIPFPNSRGVSFYKVDETGKLIYARDIVEPPFKPGPAAFAILRLVAPLVKRFVKADGTTPRTVTEESDSSTPLSSLGPASFSLFFLGIAYTYILLLSPSGQFVPGDPAWNIQKAQIDEVVQCSADFFFILSALNAAGLHFIEASTALHPVTKGLFNLAESFIFMFLPLLAQDAKIKKLPEKKLLQFWGAAMFLTNVFLAPLMGLRSMQEPDMSSKKGALEDKAVRRIIGGIGLGVGVYSLFYSAFGDVPVEFASDSTLSERLAFFSNQLSTSRIAFAFSVDVLLFSFFQCILMASLEEEQAPPWRFIPFFGLAGWLLI